MLTGQAEAIDAYVREAFCRTKNVSVLRDCLETLVLAARKTLDRGNLESLMRLNNPRWKVEGSEEKEGEFARRLVTARLMAKRAETVDNILVKEDEGSVMFCGM